MIRALILATVIATPLLGGEEGGQLKQQLGWIAGTWEGPMWGGTFTAHYSIPADGAMLSYSELRRGRKIALYEFERFYVNDAGTFYTPYPGGRRKETFKLARLAKDESAVFENPKKDFPTRITFARDKDVLTITLAEIKGEKTQVFTLKRIGAGAR